MIRIRRVYTTALAGDRARVERVKEIFRANFPGAADYARKIPDLLDHPFKYGYKAVLLVSEDASRRATGFALSLHFPETESSLLDFVAVSPDVHGGGLGSALYEATREYLSGLGSRGLYMEVLPDDPSIVKDPQVLKNNRARLRFYERYGVRPVVGTDYETPIGGSPAPYLLFDGLGREKPLGRAEARVAVRLILRRKYGHLVGPDYVRRVVESFVDDPVRFREPRYVKGADRPHEVRPSRLEKDFALIASQAHAIHHVRERGYVERPARVGAILEGLAPTGLFTRIEPRHAGEEHIRKVHDADFVAYLKAVCRGLKGRRPVYPYVFPVRRPERRPKDLAVRAGYYCVDTFTPLDENAYEAARAAVDVALAGAEEVVRGRRVAYAVCRPPGHHAGRRTFGGFCYFNNAAIAAERLSGLGKVAVVDIDYHHPNGTQDIFYGRADVLTISIHGHPNTAYPYFSGFADETGEGRGVGFNRNFPLDENAGEADYLATLDKAAQAVARFGPAFLVISLGLDTMKGDPTGSFDLAAGALKKIGRRLGALGLPTLVVQEGGYSLRNLRRGAPAFFAGLAEAVVEAAPGPVERAGGR